MTLFKLLSLSLAVLVILLSLYYFYQGGKLPENTEITKIVVLKSERKLLAFSNGKLIKTYSISLGQNPIGHKQFEGDMKTPEGVYTIYNKNPNSAFHKNLGISYPNQQDLDYAESQGKSAGGAIKIHGLANGWGFIGKFHRWRDWTHGCIAVDNKEIDELFYSVKIGADIEIKP